MCLGNDSLEGEDNDKSGLVVGVDIAVIPQQVRLSNICNSQNTNQGATSINDLNDLFLRTFCSWILYHQIRGKTLFTLDICVCVTVKV